jgi:sortase A
VTRTASLILALSLAATAGVQAAGAALVYGKAWLAPQLIAVAWRRGADDGRIVKPWPWADTWPVARLAIPTLAAERFVLAGDSGHALAFGPGLAGGVMPGEPGLSMIAGHRDTHFRILRRLSGGETIVLDHAGRTLHYRVERTLVVDARPGTLPGELPGRGLLLVTCFPFDAVHAGGPLRFVVVARQITRRDGAGDALSPLPRGGLHSL